MRRIPVSEAIVLGSTMLKPMAGRRIEGEYGCAMGMAEVALGFKQPAESYDCQIERQQGYGWLRYRSLKVPCECKIKGVMPIGGIIEHLFDAHVMQEPVFSPENLHPSVWTMEQLVDWVRSVEPKAKARETKTVDATELVKA